MSFETFNHLLFAFCVILSWELAKYVVLALMRSRTVWSAIAFLLSLYWVLLTPSELLLLERSDPWADWVLFIGRVKKRIGL